MTEDEVQKLDHGLYRIFWNDGGSSLAAVGSHGDGTRWFRPCNWRSNGGGADRSVVKHAKLLMSDDTVIDAEPGTTINLFAGELIILAIERDKMVRGRHNGRVLEVSPNTTTEEIFRQWDEQASGLRQAAEANAKAAIKEALTSEPKFKTGDLVRLKSGGPAMTVAGAVASTGHDNSTVIYEVCWFDGFKLENQTFGEAELVATSLEIPASPTQESWRHEQRTAL